ncbi:MAG: M15 family metallopeptidase [Litoreibacter sp.]
MKQGALIGPIIIAIGLICAALVFAVVGAVLQTADGGVELRLDRAETDIEALSDALETMRDTLRETEEALNQQVENIALLGRETQTSVTPTIKFSEPEPGDHVATKQPTEIMTLAKERFNKGITQPRNSTMLSLLGQPRNQYGTNCEPITNPKLKTRVETRQVGPIRVTLLKPALESLERIFAKLKATEPDLYAVLGTAGGTCVRLIRGSRSSISNHSFGTAIDVKLQGELDGFGDGGTQFGLLLLAELFNEEGWYWGATYRREDSMHFEVGEETLHRWRREGKI